MPNYFRIDVPHHICQLKSHYFFSRSIKTIEQGMGLDFKLMIITLLCIFAGLITSFIVNWKLSLIILCVVPFITGASYIFSNV